MAVRTGIEPFAGIAAQFQKPSRHMQADETGVVGAQEPVELAPGPRILEALG